MLLAASAVLLVLVALGAWYALKPKPLPLVARFRVEAITLGDVVREVRATGHLEAVTTVQVGAEISGRLAAVEVEHNDRVKAGQVLARFDRAALSAQLAQLTATLSQARAVLAESQTDRERLAIDKNRAERLFSAGGATEAAVEDARAALTLAAHKVSAAEAEVAAQTAALQLAQTTLDHTLVRSPIDGVVIARNVDPGQTVAATLASPVLFTVAADLRRMQVIAAVDEADIGEVVNGQPVTFTVNAFPERTFSGRVVEVRNASEVIQDVVTYPVEIDVDNTDLLLRPGMTADVRVRTAVQAGALRVPTMALHFTPPGSPSLAGKRVWLLRGGELRHVDVAGGVSDGELTAVVSKELTPGDKLIVELTREGRTAYGIAR